MTGITRLREQDLGPLVRRMVQAIATAIATEHRDTLRPLPDLVVAGALACAITGQSIHLVDNDLFDRDLWNDALDIASDQSSLTNTYLKLNG